MVRTLPILAAILLAGTGAVSVASALEGGAGELVCDNQVRALARDLEARSMAMSAERYRDFRRRLRIARRECPQGLDAVLPQLTVVQQQLDAIPVPAAPPPGGGGNPRNSGDRPQ